MSKFILWCFFMKIEVFLTHGTKSVVSELTLSLEGSTLAHKKWICSSRVDSNIGGVDPSRKVRNLKMLSQSCWLHKGRGRPWQKNTEHRNFMCQSWSRLQHWRGWPRQVKQKVVFVLCRWRVDPNRGRVDSSSGESTPAFTESTPALLTAYNG